MDGVVVLLVEHWLTLFALSLTRIAAFIMTFPLFRAVGMPRMVKVAIAFALAVTASAYQASSANPVSPASIDFGSLPWLGGGLKVAREALVGGILGFGCGLWLAPARIAGSYIGQEMGLGMATLTNPSSGESTTVVAELFFVLSAIVFLVSDAHLLVIRTLFRTFDRFPLGGGIATEHMILFSKGMNESQAMGIQIAAPIAAILFLSTIGLSTMMKAIPQFNLFTFGSAIRVFCGLVSMFVFLPEIILLMERVFRNMHVAAQRFGL
ncbi:flagellar biosynthetic protein FliR [Planctomycetota bacterium]